MSVDKQKVLEMLGAGVSNEQVASAVGCTPGYVSQLMADSSFADQVIALRVAALTDASNRDKRILKIEDELIDQLEQAVEMRSFMKPRDLLAAFATVNASKKKGVAGAEAMTINQQVVNLNIPPVVIRNFTQNSVGEVIEVEGQTLVTMPAHTLLKELVSKAGVNNEQYSKVSRHLPSAIEHGVHQAGRDEKVVNG